jgi:hypothetical protein
VAVDKAIDQIVRERARGLCEYCHAPQALYPERFQIDHVVARQHGGPTSPENLALCCIECNRRKGPNLAGIDPVISTRSDLFDPRRDDWNEHFLGHGVTLVGRTEKGRATVTVLDINRPPRVLVRETLMLEGVFPPAGNRSDAQ